jgi:dTDP-glucose 4,6-dehydratase
LEAYLVTGGAGFLGSHLCDFLLHKGHFVIAVDNLLTGSGRNIAHNLGNPRFRFMEYDVTNYIHVETKLDGIFHLASPASPLDYLKFPIETLLVGSTGTLRVLELARHHRARFLISSTSEVYGDPLVHPQAEDYWGNVNPIGPRSVYDEAKRYAESLVMAFHREYQLDTRIVRIFNTYGPRMKLDDGRVVPTFIKQALDGEPLTVFGDGLQTRSFCYVSDLIEGMYRLMMSSYHLPVNIGNPKEITMLKLANTILKLTGSKSSIDYRPLPADDPRLRKPDISKAREVLEWKPQVGLFEGLKRTIKYFTEPSCNTEAECLSVRFDEVMQRGLCM